MEKRIQIKESDRQSILRLHEEYKMSLLSEQASTGTTTGNTTTTGATTGNTTTERWKTATCDGSEKSTRCKDKVLQVQMKINDKCSTNQLAAKLVEDGIWGPKTSSAFTACGGTISTQGGPTTTTTTIASGGGSTTTTTTGQGTQQNFINAADPDFQ